MAGCDGSSPRCRRFRPLKYRKARLESLQARARALQHPRLGIKLIPADQVELAEALAQDRAEVVLQIRLHAGHRRWHALEQPPRDFIDP